ncbi:hypothetical protein [Clostridium sp. 1001271B_151109_B4]|uniref:hypothetical protein n=1 Tax=Clostridium sp. 1001271B_151109_B4 TaxID=2787148 RepID=UPI0018AAA32A|nr:hypothetical protein [Clostridium sp. 1001271B_151109_B4]
MQSITYNNVEKILVNDENINYCLGCRACKLNEGICIHKNYMTEILDKIIGSDIIVLHHQYTFIALMHK